MGLRDALNVFIAVVVIVVCVLLPILGLGVLAGLSLTGGDGARGDLPMTDWTTRSRGETTPGVGRGGEG